MNRNEISHLALGGEFSSQNSAIDVRIKLDTLRDTVLEAGRELEFRNKDYFCIHISKLIEIHHSLYSHSVIDVKLDDEDSNVSWNHLAINNWGKILDELFFEELERFRGVI